MKTRITNVLIATIQLLITAVWVPTVWTLAELPWTLNEEREASALLRYVDDDLGTVSYSYKKSDENCNKNKEKNWLLEDEPEEKYSNSYFDNLWCESELTTSTGSSFIPLVVLTLICIAVQYLLIGQVTLRFIKGKNDEDP